MRKIFLLCIVTALILIGCSAKSKPTNSQASDTQVATPSTPVTLEDSSTTTSNAKNNYTDLPVEKEEETSKAAEAPISVEESLATDTSTSTEEYFTNDMLDLDAYASRIGYIKLDSEPQVFPGNACYVINNHGQDFYLFCNMHSIFFAFYRDGLCYTCSFPCKDINTPFNVAYDEFETVFDKQYVENQTYLIQYFATNNPSDEDLRQLEQPGGDFPYSISVCHDEPKYTKSGWIDPTQFRNTDLDLSYIKK